MKRLLVALLIAALALAVCAPALGEAEPEAAIANPWADITAEEAEEALGVLIGVPEGAEDVRYAILEDEGLVEMDFTWYDMEYYARIQPAEGFVEISGLYMDHWDQTLDVEIGPWTAVEHRGEDDGVIRNLIQWYDEDAGLMYCVVTSGEDLDGFDISAAALAIYAPAMAEA